MASWRAKKAARRRGKSRRLWAAIKRTDWRPERRVLAFWRSATKRAGTQMTRIGRPETVLGHLEEWPASSARAGQIWPRARRLEGSKTRRIEGSKEENWRASGKKVGQFLPWGQLEQFGQAVVSSVALRLQWSGTKAKWWQINKSLGRATGATRDTFPQTVYGSSAGETWAAGQMGGQLASFRPPAARGAPSCRHLCPEGALWQAS